MKKKKVLSLLLALCLCAGLFTVPASAAEETQFDFQPYSFDTHGYLVSGESVNLRLTFDAAATGYEFAYYETFNVFPVYGDDGGEEPEYYEYIYSSVFLYTYPVVVLKDDSHVEIEALDDNGDTHPLESPLDSVYASYHSGFHDEDNTMVLNPYFEEGYLHVPEVTSGSVNDYVIRMEDNVATATKATIEGEKTYFVRASDAKLFQVTPQGVPAPNRIAQPSTQTVTVDGTPVEFQMYAVQATNGGWTNYINLRDLALALNGTKAQFNVDWDNRDILLDPGVAYVPNGSENSTPFSGPRAYEPSEAATLINGSYAHMNSILLKDDQGGGYTYFKLRDLGKKLDFNVGWNAESGVFIDTAQPYSEDN